MQNANSVFDYQHCRTGDKYRRIGNHHKEEVMRKTKTSTEVKRRYNEKVYTRLVVNVPKDTAAAFKAKCIEKGIPQAQIFKAAISQFLEEP